MFDRLINHAKSGTFDITALVRSPEKAKKLEVFGVHGVVGQTSETEKLQSLVAQADFVFSTVSIQPSYLCTADRRYSGRCR